MTELGRAADEEAVETRVVRVEITSDTHTVKLGSFIASARCCSMELIKCLKQFKIRCRSRCRKVGSKRKVKR